jgi:hypothetical protein
LHDKLVRANCIDESFAQNQFLQRTVSASADSKYFVVLRFPDLPEIRVIVRHVWVGGQRVADEQDFRLVGDVIPLAKTIAVCPEHRSAARLTGPAHRW